MLPNQIPVAPVGMVMSHFYGAILTANIVLAAAVLFWTVRESIKTQRSLPVFIMFGAGIACLLECIFDVNVLVWWAQYGQMPLYRIFNISVPIWMLFAYPWYTGGMGYWAYRAFKNNMTRSTLWKLYFFGWLSNLFLEIPPLQLGHIYTYYGDQPLCILGFPLWMAMTNSLMPILTGALLYSLDDVLKGARSLLILALVPMAVGSAEIASGWPMWLALNSGDGYRATYFAALLTLGFSLLITYLVSLKFCVAPATVISLSGEKFYTSSNEKSPVVRT